MTERLPWGMGECKCKHGSDCHEAKKPHPCEHRDVKRDSCKRYRPVRAERRKGGVRG